LAHIAIADDHVLVRDALARVMAETGHRVTAVSTLTEVAAPST
jgi:hypothetical protein